ncbi:DUF3080 family protein [Alteromonas gracilis]|uniref:DUF3080 family protein n=1 Tax=Alteromonas gracilis TaxID=1479524 RepID=UPI0037364CD7
MTFSQLNQACQYTILSISLFVLAGCFGGDTVKKSIKDYAERLSRVLDTSLPDTFDDHLVTPLPRLTDSATLKHNIEGISINLREFYALQDCELGTVVAQRNTSLGKSQLPSQRLVHESKLLSVLKNCEARLKEKKEVNQSETALAATIASWQEQKARDYTKTWANLIQSSQEVRLALNTPERLFSVENNKDALSSVNALFYLNSLNEGKLEDSDTNIDSPIDSSELEQQLQIIRSARLPATLWHTQQILANSLSQLTQMLNTELDAVSCPQGRASDKAKILRNVFYLFFIEEIQPVGSLVNQYHYKLAPLWEAWLAEPSLHNDFKRYIKQQTQDGFTQYSNAMQEHVNLWQGFLGRCNLSPVAPVS